MHRRQTVRGWLLLIICGACAHAPPPRATCGGGFSALSQPATTDLATALDHRPAAQTVTAVRVTGVAPALARTLANGLATRVGMTVMEAPLQDDVRGLFRSGVIADARVELVGDTEIEFAVVPRAPVERVEIRGSDPQLARRFQLLVGAAYEPSRIRRMAEAAQLAYTRAGWLEATVEARRRVTARGVALCVAANRGPRLTISELTFPGRTAVPAPALVAAMKGDPKVNRVGGVFDAGGFELDKLYLQVEYWERGHANVRVGEPRAVRKANRLVVEIPIDEGPVFTFGQLSASARIDGLAGRLPIAPGERFSRTKVMAALDVLRALPGVDDVTPSTHLDTEHRTIDITFDIRWRWPWYALSHWRS